MYPALANEELIKHARLGSTFRLGTYGEADLPGLTDRLREHGVGLEATPREKCLSLPQDIASLLAPPGGNASALLQPSALETGESIRFLLESTGCFHHQAWVLEWSSAKAPTIDIWNVEWDKAGHLVQTYAGMTTIADSEARGLDALLALYRLMKDKNAGRCTTRERVFVEYYRDGKKIGHEEFDDMVCHILLHAPDGWDLEKHLPAYSQLLGQAGRLPETDRGASLREVATTSSTRAQRPGPELLLGS